VLGSSPRTEWLLKVTLPPGASRHLVRSGPDTGVRDVIEVYA
jgi:hypothetical protein